MKTTRNIIIQCCNNTHQGAPHTGKQTILTHVYRTAVLVRIAGMLTSPEVDKAEANSHEAKANSREVGARIALIFFSQVLHFVSIF